MYIYILYIYVYVYIKNIYTYTSKIRYDILHILYVSIIYLYTYLHIYICIMPLIRAVMPFRSKLLTLAPQIHVDQKSLVVLFSERFSYTWHGEFTNDWNPEARGQQQKHQRLLTFFFDFFGGQWPACWLNPVTRTFEVQQCQTQVATMGHRLKRKHLAVCQGLDFCPRILVRFGKRQWHAACRMPTVILARFDLRPMPSIVFKAGFAPFATRQNKKSTHGVEGQYFWMDGEDWVMILLLKSCTTWHVSNLVGNGINVRQTVGPQNAPVQCYNNPSCYPLIPSVTGHVQAFWIFASLEPFIPPLGGPGEKMARGSVQKVERKPIFSTRL